jgi:hypothetical protein
LFAANPTSAELVRAAQGADLAYGVAEVDGGESFLAVVGVDGFRPSASPERAGKTLRDAVR